MLRDTQAAIDAVKDVGPVGIIGFCLGGSIAYAAATKLSGLSAAVGYYGGAVVRFADDKPKVPTQLHFGEKDAGIPLTDVETIRAKRPDVEVFIYPGAQHGFHCDERASYDKASADIAWPRSLGLLCQAFEEVTTQRIAGCVGIDPPMRTCIIEDGAWRKPGNDELRVRSEPALADQHGIARADGGAERHHEAVASRLHRCGSA